MVMEGINGSWCGGEERGVRDWVRELVEEEGRREGSAMWDGVGRRADRAGLKGKGKGRN